MRPAEAQQDVTVVLATYNGERFLDEQLASIAAQTFRPVELVVSDDGSTDRTAEIVADFTRSAPFPVRWSVNTERLGYAKNFMQAAASVRSGLIAFSDQDDVWLPSKLAAGVAPFARSEVMLTVHGALVVGADLSAIDGRSRRTGIVSRALLSRPWVTPLGSRMLCRARLFHDLSVERLPMSLDLNTAFAPHDEWVHYAALALGRVVYLREPLLLYRRHAATTTTLSADRGRRRWLTPPSPSLLAHHAEVARSRAQCLRADASRLDDADVRGRLLAAAAGYDRAATHLSRRRDLLSAGSRVVLVRRMAGLAVRGGYGTARRGGLGWLPLAQDLSRLGSSPSS